MFSLCRCAITGHKRVLAYQKTAEDRLLDDVQREDARRGTQSSASSCRRLGRLMTAVLVRQMISKGLKDNKILSEAGPVQAG